MTYAFSILKGRVMLEGVILFPQYALNSWGWSPVIYSLDYNKFQGEFI